MAWLALVRDTIVLGIGGLALGAASLAVRLDVAWTPPPQAPEPTACGVDDAIAWEQPAVERPALRHMAVADLAARVQAVVVVDARPAAAFAGGHIPGAISLPAADIDAVVATESLPLPVDRDIVTYCDRADGVDAQYVGQVLDATLGCDRVHVLEGGYGAWVSADAPIEGVLQSG